MFNVKNRSDVKQSFRLKDGKSVTLSPGESKNLDLPDDYKKNVQMKAMLHLGLVVVGPAVSSATPNVARQGNAMPASVNQRK